MHYAAIFKQEKKKHLYKPNGLMDNSEHNGEENILMSLPEIELHPSNHS
jgi:hypothetical protein